MINWVQKIIGWAPTAFTWLVTAAIGSALQFFSMARLVGSLAR
jgi:hypothetical protein